MKTVKISHPLMPFHFFFISLEIMLSGINIRLWQLLIGAPPAFICMNKLPNITLAAARNTEDPALCQQNDNKL